MGVRDLAPKAGDAGVVAAIGALGGPQAAAIPLAMKGGRFVSGDTTNGSPDPPPFPRTRGLAVQSRSVMVHYRR
jgi:hypothetical protein